MQTLVQLKSKLRACAFALVTASLTACSVQSGDSASQRRPIAAYCPYVSSPRAFANSMTVTGTAKYEYRIDGNGVVPNGSNAVIPTVQANSSAMTYTITVNGGTAQTINCSDPCTLTKAVRLIVDRYDDDSATGALVGHGVSAVGFYRRNSTTPVTITGLSNLTFADAKPIRYAEVRATNSAGEIVQCAETNASGAFSMALPSDGQSYTVSVLSRSSNSLNTGYIMNNPTDNEPYALSQTVQSTTGAALNYRAPATGSLEGGAFNILDQIANSQAYLRSATANCATSFTGCQPFTVAPIVFTYWSPGVSPGIYYGVSGGISYYLNGNRELYILGGVNGDTTASDMDHFDNSVVIHEYGHFIEDQYGKPNSPGGSHNGNSIIDPRLAWGEGWANFFQGAVTGLPFYRDTKGFVNCGTNCNTLVSFNEPLEDNTGYLMHDNPSTLGEGNFREFSVSRFLWSIRKSASSGFAEIWSSLNGSNGGMRSVSDSYKSIGRFHVIQNSSTGSGKTSWSTAQGNERQRPNFTDYATRISTAAGCTPTSTTMTINRASGDNGSFASSNLFQNNDFLVYEHTGGALTVTLAWTGSSPADLDLYLYKPGYAFGDSDASSMAASDAAESTSSSGNAAVSASLPAGSYMINVMAYTGLYQSLGNYTTNYTLRINGQVACPSVN